MASWPALNKTPASSLRANELAGVLLPEGVLLWETLLMALGVAPPARTGGRATAASRGAPRPPTPPQLKSREIYYPLGWNPLRISFGEGQIPSLLFTTATTPRNMT